MGSCADIALPIVRVGDFSTGHLCFPPTPCDSTPQGSVFANGILIGVQNATYVSHPCLPSFSSWHYGVPGDHALDEVSETVFAEGIGVGRIGDACFCGDWAGQGSPNVYAGG